MTSSGKQLASAGLAVGLMLLQVAVIALSPSELAVRVVLPATIALVPIALWPYRHMLGVWVMFVGMAANLAVIVANGGLMPIEHATVVEAVGPERAAQYAPGAWIAGSKDVLVAPGDGIATALGDRIIVRTGGGNGFAASPGDVVVWCGIVIVAAEMSLRWQRRRAHHAPAIPTAGDPPPPPGEAGRAEGSASTSR